MKRGKKTNYRTQVFRKLLQIEARNKGYSDKEIVDGVLRTIITDFIDEKCLKPQRS